MGVDLRLLVVDGNCGDLRWGFSHTMLEFGRHYEAHARIETYCKPHERRDFQLSTFAAKLPNGERGYGTYETTAYGEPLTYVYAGDFVKSFEGIELFRPQKAAVAYCAELDPKTLIGLDWH